MSSQSLRRSRRSPRLEQLESRLALSGIAADFRISQMGPDGDSNFDAGAPAVAYNTNEHEYLVVWAGDDTTDGDNEIYGQLVDAETGNQIGADFQISQMAVRAFGNPVGEPAVAYNSARNEYLVAWTAPFNDDGSGSAIFAQRLDASGEEIGGNDIRISGDHFCFGPAVAYNSADDQYLVVFTGIDLADEYIFGQRIEGETGAQIGDDFRIADMGPPGEGVTTFFVAAQAALAYNSTDNEYLVVWTGEDDTAPRVRLEYEIFGQRLNARTGAELGDDDFRISDAGPDGDVNFAANAPDVAYNSANNEYFVVWVADDGTDDEFEIFGQRLTGSTGAETGTNDFRISHMGSDGSAAFEASNPAVAYDGTGNEYLVIWQADDNRAGQVDDEFETFGQLFNANPAAFEEVGPTDFRISSMGTNGDTAFAAKTPALAASRTEFLAIWAGDTNAAPLVDDEFEIFSHRVGLIDRARALYDPSRHELVIEGSRGEDTISLSADDSGDIVIMAGGTPMVPTDPATGKVQQPRVASTRSVKAYLSDGFDRFDFAGDGFQAIAVGIIGEEGVDFLTLHSPAKAGQAQQFADWMFEGGDGSDSFQLIASDLSEEVALFGMLEGDWMCNEVQISDLASGELLAEFMAAAESFQATMAGGDDVVEASVERTGQMINSLLPMTVHFGFDLNDGADTLAFTWFESQPSNVSLDLQVNGGPDDDAIEAALSWGGVIGEEGLPVPVNASFGLGDGQNTLQFDFNADANVGLNLNVEGGKDVDTIETALKWGGVIGEKGLPVPVNASFDLRGGADALLFDFSSEASDINLNLNVDGGGDGDEVEVAFACPSDPSSNVIPNNFVANVGVNLGLADDVFRFTGNSAAKQSLVNVNVEGGSGEDDVYVADSNLAGTSNFNLNLGANADLLIFERNTFQALSMNASAGAGADYVLLQQNTVSGAAKLSINLDADNDSLAVLDNLFAQGLTFSANGAAGADSITYESNAVTGAAKLTFDLGTSNDNLAIRKSSFQQLTLNVRAGNGRDRVSLEGNTITAPSKLVIDLGLGKDLFLSRRNKLGKNVVLKVVDPDK